MDKLATAKTVAHRFGVSVETVRAWTRQRRIPCIRPTKGTVRFDLSAVLAALTKQAERGRP